NLIHALAVASSFGVEIAELVDALSTYVPMNNRSQILAWKGHQVYLDAYNANPTSMQQAIREFRMAHPDSGILVLGDMGELGAASAKEHRAILELVRELG